MVTDSQILGFIGVYLWPMFRILGMFTIVPIFGARLVPVPVRVALALSITVLIAPALPAYTPPTLDLPHVIYVGAQQMLIGTVMGFVLRMVFAALELGAHLIALQMGLGFAALLDPQGGVQVPTLSQFYIMVGTLIFLALNGHFLLLQLLFDSFAALPIGPLGIGPGALSSLVLWAGQMFSGAVLVALSATVALVSTNVLMGVLTRAVPQFNMFVAFPAILLLGYLVIGLNLAALDSQLESLLDSAVLLIRDNLLTGG